MADRGTGTLASLANIRWAKVGLLCTMLVGCGGGDSDGATGGDSGVQDSWCVSMAEANATVAFAQDAGCNGCSVQDRQSAADNDVNSAAHVTAHFSPGQSGPLHSEPNKGIKLRATAQPGIVFPAGDSPGAWFRLPPGYWTVVATTYLNGSKQEDSGQTQSAGNETRLEAVWLQATKPFNAVELFLSNDNASYEPSVDVWELCSDVASGFR